MKNDRFSELISRKLAGEATDAELEELAAHLKDNPDDQFFADVFSSCWNFPAARSADAATTTDEHFNHILQLAEETPSIAPEQSATPAINHTKRRRVLLWLGRASVAAALISAVLLIVNKSEKKITTDLPLQNEIIAKRGDRSKLILPDGTSVWLNSETRLKFAEGFSDTLREVYLDGEAFFDVVKDSKRPFIVHTTGIDIKVLGTSFNVKAYPEDKQTETSLIEGIVEVTLKNRAKDKVILAPSEKLIVVNQQPATPDAKPADDIKPEIAIQRLKYNAADSTLNEIQWKGNKLVFDDEPFSEVVLKMGRWYNVEIEISDERLKEKRLTGSFEKENIDQALEALTISTPFSFERNGDKIFIHR